MTDQARLNDKALEAAARAMFDSTADEITFDEAKVANDSAYRWVCEQAKAAITAYLSTLLADMPETREALEDLEGAADWIDRVIKQGPGDYDTHVEAVKIRRAATLLSLPDQGGVTVKPLTWSDERKNSSYASFEFGPETIYYSLDLVDEKLDIWEVETSVSCSEFGPTKIHRCIGRLEAKEATQTYHETRIRAALTNGGDHGTV